jgi:hypothetical protein
VRPRGFEPPRTIRSTRPSTLAIPYRRVPISLVRAAQALLVARSFAQFGPPIGPPRGERWWPAARARSPGPAQVGYRSTMLFESGHDPTRGEAANSLTAILEVAPLTTPLGLSQAHNPEVAGSNPAPAIRKGPAKRGPSVAPPACDDGGRLPIVYQSWSRCCLRCSPSAIPSTSARARTLHALGADRARAVSAPAEPPANTAFAPSRPTQDASPPPTPHRTRHPRPRRPPGEPARAAPPPARYAPPRA